MGWLLWGAVALNLVAACCCLRAALDTRRFLSQYQRYVERLEWELAQHKE